MPTGQDRLDRTTETGNACSESRLKRDKLRECVAKNRCPTALILQGFAGGGGRYLIPNYEL